MVLYPVTLLIYQNLFYKKKVNDIIASSKNIQIAPITDSFASKEYNDGERYTTIIISKGDQLNKYIFQYTGSNESWDTAKTSEVSIAYAFDKEGNGGSDGGGNFPFYKFRLKRQLVNTFKSEFIDKVVQYKQPRNETH